MRNHLILYKILFVSVLVFCSNTTIGQTSIATENWSNNNYTSGSGWTGDWTENDDDANSSTGVISIVNNELLITGSTGGAIDDAVNIFRQVDLSTYT